MSRRPAHNPFGVLRLPLVLAVIAAGAVGVCAAQVQPEADDSREGRVEAFLRTIDAPGLLAEHLRVRLDSSTGTERVEIAGRLGAVYAEMLAASPPGFEQDEVIRLSGELLQRVPAADTFDLRIALTKARYLTAEHTAEHARLRLASDEDIRAAIDVFDSVAAGLGVLGDQADRRVGAIERRERQGNISDLQALRAELAEARRERSLSRYYAGWALYYKSLLSGNPVPAADAIEAFGYLLGAEGDEPTIEGMSKSLLRYEHVARAALGVALAYSARGDHVVAGMWLDAIARSEDLNPVVAQQLFSRSVTIYSAARRWDTLARAVEKRRGVGLDQRAQRPLTENEARLLAVGVLEAFRAADSDSARREAAEPIARAALGDLVAQGKINHVIDLVERYGTLPLGDGGFIARYVRGLRAYRAARETHAAEGDDSEPTESPGVIAAYIDAADLLTHAVEADDAGGFPEERAGAGLMLGLALYYKGSPAEAADRFERTVELIEPGNAHAESLWMAVIALERAVEQGRTDLGPRLNAAVLLFVQSYPGDDRSARLMLRFGDGALFEAETVLGVLLGVDPDSPVFGAAQNRAADLLYRVYVRGREPERSDSAARFVAVALRRIDVDLELLRDASPGDPETAQLLQRLRLRIRQTLDATLTPLAADPASARRALSALDELRARAGDLAGDPSGGDGLEGELAFRRLQLAVNEDDRAAQEQAHRELEAIGGRFLEAADAFLFGRAAERWRRTRGLDHARRVVAIGDRLLGTGEIPRSLLSTAETTANAATAVWGAADDREALGIAIGIDERVLSAHAPTAELLRRLASNAEDSGDDERAREVWQRLASSVAEGSAGWYEARYESIRLLSLSDPAEARAAIRQHVILHPMYGPPPWGDRLEALEAELRRNAGGGP